MKENKIFSSSHDSVKIEKSSEDIDRKINGARKNLDYLKKEIEKDAGQLEKIKSKDPEKLTKDEEIKVAVLEHRINGLERTKGDVLDIIEGLESINREEDEKLEKFTSDTVH